MVSAAASQQRAQFPSGGGPFSVESACFPPVGAPTIKNHASEVNIQSVFPVKCTDEDLDLYLDGSNAENKISLYIMYM